MTDSTREEHCGSDGGHESAGYFIDRSLAWNRPRNSAIRRILNYHDFLDILRLAVSTAVRGLWWPSPPLALATILSFFILPDRLYGPPNATSNEY